MIGLFFAGTDTGVGKTAVTAAVASLLRRQGRAVAVCKPMATGAQWINGRWLSDDTVKLMKASGQEHEPERVTRWTFAEPLAPAVAARRAGIDVSLEDLTTFVSELQRPGRALLVEGVGGLLCPITERDTVADLAVALRLPVVIVTRRSLGTLNHTLLTVESARARKLPLAGIVVNETTPCETLADETNIEELQRWIDIPLLAVVPYQADGFVDGAAAIEAVDWWRLCHSFD